MTLQVEARNSIDDIIARSNLRVEDIEELRALKGTDLPILEVILSDLLQINPRLHFTTESFFFHPNNDRERLYFKKNAEQRNWIIEDREEEGVYIKTGYIEDICSNGLRPMSCVAVLPEETNPELMSSHPRLYLELIKRMVCKFGKHAVPYKQALCSGTGTMSNIEGGLVILNNNVPVIPKGDFRRESPSVHYYFVGTTHYAYLGAVPEDILTIGRFSVNQTAISQRRALVIDRDALANDILMGLRGDLPAMLNATNLFGNKFPKAQRALRLFLALSR